MPLLNMLKGVTGEFEINRVVGALGSLSYVVAANGFEFYQVVVKSAPFDITSYCLAFPAGLGVAVGSIAGAVALKDRSVATARVTSAAADTADATNTANADKP